MHPAQLATVLMALACGFLALAGETVVRIVRRLHMHDHLALAALCLFGVVTLVMWLVFVDARHDPAPPAPVRLDDRKTWRRHETDPMADWGFYFGMLLAGAIVVAALAVG